MAYNEWSDDDLPRSHGRDKFRHERSLERGGFDEYDRYDRKKRTRRSPTPPEERRHKRRPSYSPPPMRGGYSGARRNMHDADSDHYIPNYDRDGYVPGPRYGNKPEGQNAQNNFGYPAMDMMNAPVMNNWHGNAGRFTVDPNQVDFLVPFKQFYEYTRRTSNRRVEDEEMQKRYAHYKEKFSARQLAQFFAANKEKEWFQEKYHPTHSVARADDTKQRRRRHLESFLVDLENGKYDQVKFDKDAQTTGTEEPEEPEEPTGEPMDEDNVEYETRLVIKTVPPTIAREKIIEMCNKVEGFDYLALSEPSPNKKFHRIGWIGFKAGTDMKKAFDQLDNQKVDDFIFHLAMNRKNTPQNRAPRIAPDIANSNERLQKDFEQAKELANAMEAVLGSEGGLKAVEARALHVIEQHVPEETKTEETEDGKVDDEESTERWNLKKRLDMMIAYLRQVHMYCYYCGLECDSLEEMNRKCFEPHCRTIANTEESTDPKQIAKNERGVAQWIKNLDQKINLKIHTPDDRELKRLGGRVAQSQVDEFVKEHVLKEHDSKYKCKVGECSKAFKGYDYVEKHIMSKHPEDIERIRADAEYFNNYVCDPNHLVPNTPQNTTQFGQPMMMGGRMPPPVQAAVAGTPWDQIPRIGFDNWGFQARPRMPADLPRDPRQVKSYVDLDAPSEGDSNISFY